MHNRPAGWLVAAALVVGSACSPAHAATHPQATDGHAASAPVAVEPSIPSTTPAPSSSVVAPAGSAGSAATVGDAVAADAAALASVAATAATRAVQPPPAPADPYAPRCAGCPAVHADPATPVVVTAVGAAPPVISSIRTTDPVVFITIDDGEHWNEEAAALLEAARLPITLFLTERYVADKQPSMLRLVRAGAFVESHTRTHPNLAATPATADEICTPLDRYDTVFGRRGTLFRPPYGNSTSAVQRVAATCGIRAIVLWRASTNNGALATQGGALRAGDIILMHFRPDLADNLREVFRIIVEQHLTVGRLECYVGGDPRCGAPWR